MKSSGGQTATQAANCLTLRYRRKGQPLNQVGLSFFWRGRIKYENLSK